MRFQQRPGDKGFIAKQHILKHAMNAVGNLIDGRVVLLVGFVYPTDQASISLDIVPPRFGNQGQAVLSKVLEQWLNGRGNGGCRLWII